MINTYDTEYENVSGAKQAADSMPLDMFSLWLGVYEKPNGKFVFIATYEGKYPLSPALKGEWVLVAEKQRGRPHVQEQWIAREESQDARTQFSKHAGLSTDSDN